MFKMMTLIGVLTFFVAVVVVVVVGAGSNIICYILKLFVFIVVIKLFVVICFW